MGRLLITAVVATTIGILTPRIGKFTALAISGAYILGIAVGVSAGRNSERYRKWSGKN